MQIKSCMHQQWLGGCHVPCVNETKLLLVSNLGKSRSATNFHALLNTLLIDGETNNCYLLVARMKEMEQEQPVFQTCGI